MENIKKKTRSELNLLFSERLVVRKRLGGDIHLDGKVRVLYGETYDRLGITIDSLKYYLFLEYLVRLIGPKVEATVVEGDLHSVINPSVTKKEELLQEGRKRVGEIERIFEKLGIAQVKVGLMSELFADKQILDTVTKVSSMVKVDNDMQDKLIPTVLKNRVAQERESGFRYAAEAIGLALNYDLKVGPPREENYDALAQLIGKKIGKNYSAIYLRPSYPFTPDFSFYLIHPEIEQYGLTPYKAGSNKMQNQRITLGKTTQSEIENLIMRAYVPRDISLANPLVDLAGIVVMADQIKRHKINVRMLGEQMEIMVKDRKQLLTKLLKLLEEVV